MLLCFDTRRYKIKAKFGTLHTCKNYQRKWAKYFGYHLPIYSIKPKSDRLLAWTAARSRRLARYNYCFRRPGFLICISFSFCLILVVSIGPIVKTNYNAPQFRSSARSPQSSLPLQIKLSEIQRPVLLHWNMPTPHTA